MNSQICLVPDVWSCDSSGEVQQTSTSRCSFYFKLSNFCWIFLLWVKQINKNKNMFLKISKELSPQSQTLRIVTSEFAHTILLLHSASR